MKLEQQLISEQLAKFNIPISSESEDIELELYLGIGQDRSIGKLAFVASANSQEAIETMMVDHPDVIYRENIDPLIGLRSYQILRVASNLNLPRTLYHDFDDIVQKMYRCFIQCDATSLEFNPLILTSDGRFQVSNATMSIDDNALFRQADLIPLAYPTPIGIDAHKYGMTYFQLGGQVGCIANGAGLAMATMDVINLYGEEHDVHPANFLDIGGGADSHKIVMAFELLRQNPTVKVVFMNIFGGMTRGDEVAEGIINAYHQSPFSWPVVVRLQGTNAVEGRALLQKASLYNLHLVTTLTEGVLLTIDKAVYA
jgi:succinyl-CoA synthetase beta subunit